MHLRLQQARPTSLNDAIRHTVELEAFGRAERTKLAGQGFVSSAEIAEKNAFDPSLERLQKAVEQMGKQFSDMQNEFRQFRYTGSSA